MFIIINLIKFNNNLIYTKFKIKKKIVNNNKTIFTFFIQIFLISFFLFVNFKKAIKKNKNSLKLYFSYNICKFLVFKTNFNCSNQIYKNKNFYDYVSPNYKYINLLINVKITKIENLLLLIGIIPFLKNNSNILYQINNKDIYLLFKNLFFNKIIKKRFINIEEHDFKDFANNFNDLINYKWELIPDEDIINNIRYILNNYYNESCIELFDKSLNSNIKYLGLKVKIILFWSFN